MSNPHKKRVVQIVDASQDLQQSDLTHGSRKRKRMEPLPEEAPPPTEEPKFASLESLTKEVHQLRVDAMGKKSKRQHDMEQLKKIGANVRTPQMPTKMRFGISSAKLEREGKRYERLKELGIATGIDPRKKHALIAKSRERKAEPSGLKLHKIGRMQKDGTLSIGKGAMRKTQETIRKDRSGGAKITKIFK